jgi:hypothetical protein
MNKDKSMVVKTSQENIFLDRLQKKELVTMNNTVPKNPLGKLALQATA